MLNSPPHIMSAKACPPADRSWFLWGTVLLGTAASLALDRLRRRPAPPRPEDPRHRRWSHARLNYCHRCRAFHQAGLPVVVQRLPDGAEITETPCARCS